MAKVPTTSAQSNRFRTSRYPVKGEIGSVFATPTPVVGGATSAPSPMEQIKADRSQDFGTGDEGGGMSGTAGDVGGLAAALGNNQGIADGILGGLSPALGAIGFGLDATTGTGLTGTISNALAANNNPNFSLEPNMAVTDTSGANGSMGGGQGVSAGAGSGSVGDAIGGAGMGAADGMGGGQGVSADSSGSMGGVGDAIGGAGLGAADGMGGGQGIGVGASGLGDGIGDGSASGIGEGAGASADASGSGGGGGGVCFLTTATVQHMGHADDGPVLQALRRFRDTYMRGDAEKDREIDWYYRNAPKIVSALDANKNAAKIYRQMYSAFIAPAYAAIEAKQLDRAYSIYKKLVNFAQRKAGLGRDDLEPR